MTDRTATYGHLREADGRWQLEFSRRLPHPPAKVWRALTDPEQLDAWFPTTIEGQRVPGARLHFAFPDGDPPPRDGEMIIFAPPEILEFRWGDDDTLRFELQRDGDGTLLTFINTFGSLGKATHDGAGWHECFELLGYLLDEKSAPFESGRLWTEVRPRYQEQFGPEASRVGPPDYHW